VSQAPKAEAGQDLAGVRVLIVEDDFIIFMGMEATLLEAGAEVAYCRSLTEAQDFLAPIPKPAEERMAGILDVRLDGETSLPLAPELRAREIPFLFYSAQGDLEKIRAECPGCLVIAKPSPPRLLLSTLAGLLDKAGKATPAD
jgi:DNA-binding response OmpR family regulator